MKRSELTRVAVGMLFAVMLIQAECRAERVYYAPPSYYVVPPLGIPNEPIWLAPAPAVVPAPVYFAEPVYMPPPAAYRPPYGMFVPFRDRVRYKSRLGKLEYEYKVYSPFRLGPVYEYEVKIKNGRIRIEEDFD